MTDQDRPRGEWDRRIVPRKNLGDPSEYRPMWWCVDLVRAYARGWRDQIVTLTTEPTRLELVDMKIILPRFFDEVGKWHHELLHDPEREPALIAETARRANLTPPEHRKAFTTAVAEAEATGTDLADIRLPTVSQLHFDASNMAAAGIAYVEIARFEQHLNEKNRQAERLLGVPKSYAFPES
ncbi:hypothetical protein [Amycolatopsis sp. NPDC004079]|uniref:hypothetical protein n=1 Tax=Amycolatopsis sp. NPDC004079 TaxID=3154549 RepID=UPI0033A03096